MGIKRLVPLMAVLGVVFGSSSLLTVARCGDSKDWQVKVTNYIVSSANLPAGDREGNVIGMGKREGRAEFSDGQNAKYSAVFTFDARRGEGATSRGYTKFSFDDGSRIFLSWTATNSMQKDGLSLTEGKGTIMHGGGRLEGIKGSAVFSGKEQKPASEDPKRTVVTNATITYTLP